MFFDKGSPVGILSTDRAVVESLGTWIAANRETKWKVSVSIHDEVFLFKAEPEIFVVVVNCCAGVARMWGAVSVHYFAHHKEPVDALGVWENGNWFEQTV